MKVCIAVLCISVLPCNELLNLIRALKNLGLGLLVNPGAAHFQMQVDFPAN